MLQTQIQAFGIALAKTVGLFPSPVMTGFVVSSAERGGVGERVLHQTSIIQPAPSIGDFHHFRLVTRDS